MRSTITVCYHYLKPVFLVHTFLLLAITVFAQSAPNVQKNSLYTPGNLKIDGKASEWHDQFQAYNKATKVFYNMANNNDLLYLSIKATDATTVIKILTNGITLTVDHASNNSHVSITFPLTQMNDLANVKNGIRKKASVTTADSVVIIKAADSAARVWNGQIALKLKEIKVNGIKELPDTISVYNENGIKAVLSLDNKKACIYELAVPLKYLGLNVNVANLASFNYAIQLNGSPQVKGLTVQISADGRGIDRTFEGTTVSMASSPEQIALTFPVNFKGKYTLAQK